MQFDHTVQIRAPIQQVFAALNDVERLPRWMSGLQRTEIPPSFDPYAPVGGSYRQHMVQFGYPLVYTVTVTRFDPPDYISLNLVARYFTLDIYYALTSVAPASTLLHCTTQISRTEWSVRLLQRMIADKMLDVVQQQMESFKKMIEETT